MTVKFSKIVSVCNGKTLQQSGDPDIRTLSTDSRKGPATSATLFFAIDGENHDGHEFIDQLYHHGVENFVVERIVDVKQYPKGNFLLVNSSLDALQKVASYHRNQYTYPVVGITGSNGKTIIKEWLFQLLSSEYNVVKNPGSYNSQIGVPLSVWQMDSHHQIGIFEAGISRKGEMEKLEKVIRPTIGILSNIGTAHDEGFDSRDEKIMEKAKLFANSDTIIYCGDHGPVAAFLKKVYPKKKMISWGANGENLVLKYINADLVAIKGDFGAGTLKLPLADYASKENLFHVISLMLYLGYSFEQIQDRIGSVRSVPMRLELKEGLNGSQVIDDSYNCDLGGLQISLDFLKGINHQKKVLILSDILQSGLDDETLIEQISELVKQSSVSRFIGIGKTLSSHSRGFQKLPVASNFFENTDQFLKDANWDDFNRELILVKGARSFEFERIVKRLEKKIHGTVMEIDMQAIRHNLNFFRSLLKPEVKLMVMVKAFAYGSGSIEIANLLQYHHVDYLGVAYADEGVELRAGGIRLPVMVMNPSEESFALLLENNLEPEIYSLDMLKSFSTFLAGKDAKIHLKLDTGMHRLGFGEQDINELIALLKDSKNIQIASVFTHLAGSEAPEHDSFTRAQINEFSRQVSRIKAALSIDPILHALNSGGILRFPDFQFGMVRLGIGLYGIDPSREFSSSLRPVVRLRTTVSQVKKISKGVTVGYGRKGLAEEDTTIATVAIGYADGYVRNFGNGRGRMMIRGKLAPVFGNVCMDMTMLDVTHIEDVEAGDEVVVFGGDLPIEAVASQINTIPYELLTNTSQRVKRIFFAESI